ncbi:hypothetical protein PspLS_05243 [Pyricularia sp. CBS 133598]|nr:hypothetical protein PspLS_05243 [Pyricularia sp. CBS 133598]
MSGAEVIGVLSGIITLVKTSQAIYDAASDVSGLPRFLRDVESRLPLIQDTLEVARRDLAVDDNGALSSPSSCEALAKVLRSCRARLDGLYEIIKAAVPAADAPRTERYLKALKTMPSAAKAEGLMDGALRDLELLAHSQAFKAATRAQVERLIVAVRERASDAKDGGPGPRLNPVNYSDWPVALFNTGTGSQYVHTGTGDQNVATGRGVQINGSSAGPFYFTM